MKHLNQTVRGPSGMSLVEVSIALGLMSVAALALTQIYESQFKAQKSADFNVEFNSLVRELSQILDVKGGCGVNFADPSFAYVIPSSGSIDIPVGQCVWYPKDIGVRGSSLICVKAADSSGFIAEYGHLKISSMKLSEFEGSSPSYIAKLVITASKYSLSDNATAYGSRELTKKIPFTIRTNSENRIIDCGGSLNPPEPTYYFPPGDPSSDGGNKGGVAFNQTCPQGMLMNGYEVRHGERVDAFRPYCQSYKNPDDVWVGNIQGGLEGNNSGGVRKCPDHTFLTGIDVTQRGKIESVVGHCKSLDGATVGKIERTGGTEDGHLTEMHCKPGYFIHEVHGRANSDIDNLLVSCRSKP
jgi:hypothetical protein